MKIQPQKAERERVQKIAQDYIGKRGDFRDAEYVFKRAGVTMKHILQTYGLKKEMYSSFIEEMAGLGYYAWKDLAKELGVSTEGIKDAEHDDSKFSLDLILDTGDRVLIAPHAVFTRGDQGQFLTGFNPKTEKFTFGAEADYSGHSQLEGRLFKDESIIEGGFTRIYPLQKTIELYGMSDTFQVYPGNISLNLLKRALPNWAIGKEC